MSQSLKPGLSFEYEFPVPWQRTVPHLIPDSPEFQEMPNVLATGYMVGLFEWACVKAIKPFIDWPGQQTVGTHVDLSHTSPTPPGATVKVKGQLKDVEGRKLTFLVEGHDQRDCISKGTHERYIIDSEKFRNKISTKAEGVATTDFQKLTPVSFTAESVAAYRAIGAMDPDERTRNPDHLARHFVTPEFWHYTPYNPHFEKSMQFIRALQIGIFYYVTARTRYIDGILKEVADDGLEQVVILGAGFDSRAHRFAEPYPEIEYFELDSAYLIHRKKEMVRNIFGTSPDRVHYVPLDLDEEELEVGLARTPFSQNKRTLFIWEGVSYYVSEKTAYRTLKFVSDNMAPGSGLVFDYIPDSVIKGDYHNFPDAMIDSLMVACAGEPFIFGFPENMEETEDAISKMGFHVAAHVKSDAFEQMFLIGSDGDSIGKPSSYFRTMFATG